MTRALRILAVGHFVVAAALVPISAFMGVGTAPVLFAVPVWFGVLGIWLFRPSETLRRTLRATHLVTAPFAVWICAYGFFALRAAERSAEEGGGLLGAVGLLPIVTGILIAIVSVSTLAAIRAWPDES